MPLSGCLIQYGSIKSTPEFPEIGKGSRTTKPLLCNRICRIFSIHRYESSGQLLLPPPHIATRLAVQHSRFTLSGTDVNGFDKIIARHVGNSRLMKLTIDRRAIHQIRDDLAFCGISETTFFPELEALGRDLTANPPKLD